MGIKIKYAMDSEGGFTAGIIGTNLTAYAYPTSSRATNARRNPATVANQMLNQDHLDYYRSFVQLCGYERLVERGQRDWAHINAIAS